MIKRRRTAVLGAFAVAASIFLLPTSQASAVTFDNACVNSLIPTQASLIPITMTASATPNPVAPGGTVTLSNIQQHADIPPAVFVAGYNAGALAAGVNNIPITNIHTVIEGTNTTQGTQVTNNATSSATTTITDPDGVAGTGDESATAGALDVTYANQTWTAGASGTIDFREDTVVLPPPVPDPPGFTNLSAGINITAVVAGILTVRFGCDPGTVVESAPPNTIVRTDPAPSFASTTIQTTPVNDPPVANAGPDQTVTSGDTVNLTGAASSDPNGDPLTFAWTQPSGPVVTLSGANTATPSFTAPSVTTNTDLTFSLQVCDPEPLCSTDTVVVTVQPQPTVNVPPVANAGPDQTVTSGDTVNLTGAASSDPNGDTLTFAWTQPSGPVVTLSGANTATPSFTAPSVTTNTDLTFSLQVCDPEPLCSTDTVVVTVQPQPTVNVPPVANAGPDQTVTSGDTVNLTGAASSDPNGDTLTFAWTQPSGPVVTLSGANTATPSFTAPSVTTNTDLTFSLQVCDPEPLCSTDTVVVTVQPQPTVNVPPVANAGPDQTVTSGDTVNLTGAASSDPNGDTLTFAWTQPSGPVVTLSGANTATPSFTAPSVTTNTDLTFSLQVCDPEPLCSTDTVVVTVQPQPTVNVPPVANAGPDQTVTSGDTVNLTGAASSDPNGDTLTFAWTQPSGPVVTLSGANTATPSFTAPSVTTNTDLTFSLQVCDPEPLCSTDTVVVTVQPPVVEGIDAAGDVIVNGPVQAKKDTKVYVFRVTNLGDSPITVDPTTDIDAVVNVNGAPNGSVTSLTGTKTIKPGKSARFRLEWTQDGTLAAGDTVEFTACVNLAGDSDPTNNCDSETRTAVGKHHCGHGHGDGDKGRH